MMRPVYDDGDDDSGHEHHHHAEAHSAHPPHDLGAIARFDARVDRAFDRVRGTEPADRILYAVTELGDFGLIWILIGGARALRSEAKLREGFRLIACMAVESVLVNGAVKTLFKRERPVVQESRPYNIRIPLTTSFPSGHASSAMFAATLLSERNKAAPLYWSLAALVATSRAYVRIHHASDVVGGVAIGLALVAVAKRAWPLTNARDTTRRTRNGRRGNARRA